MIPNLTYGIQLLNIWIIILFLKKFFIQFLVEELTKKQNNASLVNLTRQKLLIELTQLKANSLLNKKEFVQTASLILQKVNTSPISLQISEDSLTPIYKNIFKSQNSILERPTDLSSKNIVETIAYWAKS